MPFDDLVVGHEGVEQHVLVVRASVVRMSIAIPGETDIGRV
jgi:hypothetical protein